LLRAEAVVHGASAPQRLFPAEGLRSCSAVTTFTAIFELCCTVYPFTFSLLVTLV
jgi:hypothetical protein